MPVSVTTYENDLNYCFKKLFLARSQAGTGMAQHLLQGERAGPNRVGREGQMTDCEDTHGDVAGFHAGCPEHGWHYTRHTGKTI